MEKKRLDILLHERALADSRQRAQSLVMAGRVFVDGKREDKPGTKFPPEVQIEVRGGGHDFVSRGGLKLERALELFPVRVSGAAAADIGASTGGFTDCLLRRGARRVYAVDVGYGQLAWSVRTDPRVVCLERTNARYLTRAQIPETLDLAAIDVSFISLRLILPAVCPLLREGGEAVCLIKPQFEAGREKVGKRGVVRDPAVHREVLEGFLRHADEAGFFVNGMTHSPIRGPEGNIEYLAWLTGGDGPPWSGCLDAVLRGADEELR